MATGDIQLANSDCAEDFEVVAAVGVESGTVMVLNDDGQLEQGTKPYDKRVTGVVSGAGDLRAYTKTDYAISIYAASANFTGSHNRLSIKRIDAI